MRYLSLYEMFAGARKEFDDVSTLQEFCNDYLVYLIDDGFRVNCYRESYSSWSVNIMAAPGGTLSFKWDDVKDQVIPFISMLQKSYKVENVIYFTSYLGSGKQFTLDEVMSDDFTYGFKVSDSFAQELSPSQRMELELELSYIVIKEVRLL